MVDRGQDRTSDGRRVAIVTGGSQGIGAGLVAGYRRRGWALRHWRHWYFWATHSRLEPVIEVARMIRDHLDNALTYLDHRITTATCEGFNSKIETIKKTPMASAIGTI